MSTMTTHDLFERLRAGNVTPEDTAFLDGADADQLLQELAQDYRFRFQERRLKNKWEISMARGLRTELLPRPRYGALFVSLLLVPVYRRSILLSGEGNRITGIAVTTRLTARPIRKPAPGLALTMGSGFKLDKAPDGWAVQPLRKRTVRLTLSVLQARGWRFNHLQQFTEKP